MHANWIIALIHLIHGVNKLLIANVYMVYSMHALQGNGGSSHLWSSFSIAVTSLPATQLKPSRTCKCNWYLIRSYKCDSTFHVPPTPFQTALNVNHSTPLDDVLVYVYCLFLLQHLSNTQSPQFTTILLLYS